MINHSNIIEYKDSGIEGDNFYIIMEYFEGETLEKTIKNNQLSHINKFEIMIQILNGVQAAHDKRIIHRDLKPANILVNSNFEVKVIDFGISKIMDIYTYKTGHTLKEYITKRYASPEHLLGQQIDFSSDIYSLGAIFYYLLTEKEPPEDRKVLYESIGNLSVSETVKDILQNALSFEKSKRYKSLISFIEDIKKEIELNTVHGNIKLFIPQIINKNLLDIGKVSNANFRTVKDYIERSLVEASIYKTEQNYYLVGNGVKYHIKPDLSKGFLRVFRAFPIDMYHENEIEKNKGIEVKLNLDIIPSPPPKMDNSELVKLINEIDRSFESFKNKIAQSEKKNKLISNWVEVLNTLKQINFSRERFGNYKSYEYDSSNNFLTINMDETFDSSMLQDGDYIKLQTKTNKFIRIGPLKNIDGNLLKVAVLSEVDLQEISNRGEARVDVSLSNQMYKRYSNALYSLKNNESVNRNLLDFLIDPAQLTMKKLDLNLKFVNNNIDDANKSAVINALKTNDIFLIQGPPGTGKSTVITEIINQIFLEDFDSKVLITSPSHVAVDHLLKNILETQSDKRIVRIGTSEKISKDATNLLATEQLKQWAREVKTHSINNTIDYIEESVPKDKSLRKFMQHRLLNNPHINPKEIDVRLFEQKTVELINIIRDWTNRLELLDEFDDIFAREASIVAATCVGIASRHTLRNLTYDWVIIDEAARATAPELILPMLLGKKIILVGDHKQLPPIVNLVHDKGLEKQINTKKLEKSLFEDIFETCTSEAKKTLTAQFRMHPVISNLVNTSFYPTYNINTKIKAENRKHDLDFDEVVLWLDTSMNLDNKEEEIHDILDSNFFNNDYNQIYFDIPMIEAYKINDEWIKDLERYLKRRLNVKIRFNGSKYPTTYIKNRVFDIIMLSQKYKNLELEHSINYEYAKVIFDKNSGYIDKISKYNLPLINNSSCITHKFFKVNNVPSELFKQSNASGNVKFISSTTELKQITKNIIESAKSLDIEMENYYGIGWLDNGEFLNEHNFANLKLASNNKNFSDFTRNLNASMVEVIERVGTNNQINKYYYNEFQTNYPDLFYALDRLKVYRNSMQHNDLNSHTLEKYSKYIETDLGGSFPEFLPNGYLILQSVILNDIYSAIKKTSGALRKVLL